MRGVANVAEKDTASSQDPWLCPASSHVFVGVIVKVGDPPPFLGVEWTNGFLPTFTDIP